MTIRRDQDRVLLEGHCDVEEAELLVQLLADGVTQIDWSGCTHLHTACLQVLLAAGLPVTGTPKNATLARFVGPILHAEAIITGQGASLSPQPAI